MAGQQMASAEKFRLYAEQCLDMAEHVSPDLRQTLHDMAGAWLGLASICYQMEPRQTAPSSKTLQ
jgi:hypothetical protein